MSNPAESEKKGEQGPPSPDDKKWAEIAELPAIPETRTTQESEKVKNEIGKAKNFTELLDIFNPEETGKNMVELEGASYNSKTIFDQIMNLSNEISKELDGGNSPDKVMLSISNIIKNLPGSEGFSTLKGKVTELSKEFMEKILEVNPDIAQKNEDPIIRAKGNIEERQNYWKQFRAH